MKSLEEVIANIQEVNIKRHHIPMNKFFPNNTLLPLLIYKQAIKEVNKHLVKELLESNRWENSWTDGVYDYHHYHSTAHEVLVVLKSSAVLEFGGPDGIIEQVEAGDVIIIPAGVGHKCNTADNDFTVLGAYPEGQDYDIMRGEENEHKTAEENIRAVPLPFSDPIFGTDGPLMKEWKSLP